MFNSFAQWEKFGPVALAQGRECGLRINPEHSTQEHAIYDPCSPYSRLGVRRRDFRPDKLEGLSGLHFHTLCEQNSDALAETLEAVEQGFGEFLPQMKWINFGGGHHITREDYDLALLRKCIRRMQEKYGLEVYIEPGEAVALKAGFLVSSVLEIIEQQTGKIAILDTSAACHMPDVLEMPYRPPLMDSAEPGEKPYTYRLTGNTCLAGDIIGDYSFDCEKKPGDTLLFEDMAIYSICKNNTFNGIALPDIAVRKEDGSCLDIRSFDYMDFKGRLS